jgi:hypothetical protein
MCPGCRWLASSEVAAEAAHDPWLKAYAKVRAAHADTIDGHLDVARWCLAKKLDDQSRPGERGLGRFRSKTSGSDDRRANERHARQRFCSRPGSDHAAGSALHIGGRQQLG